MDGFVSVNWRKQLDAVGNKLLYREMHSVFTILIAIFHGCPKGEEKRLYYRHTGYVKKTVRGWRHMRPSQKYQGDRCYDRCAIS